jgi:hypothetical protein
MAIGMQLSPCFHRFVSDVGRIAQRRRYPSDGWDCVGYIHSDKRALVSCVKAKGLKLSAAGRAALDWQDEKIHRWRLVGSTKSWSLQRDWNSADEYARLVMIANAFAVAS